MPFGWSEGIAAGGALANAITGRSQQQASKEMLRRQSQLAALQGQTYRQAQPIYQSALQAYSQHAGLGQPGGQGAGLGGAWGTPEDALRFRAAEEQNNKIAQQRQNQLMHTLAQRGVATGSQGAALAQNQRAALSELSGYRRQLAANAPQEYERRLGLLTNALGPAFGQGSAAENVYGQQGALAAQGAQNAYNGIGNIAQQYMYQRALQQYGQQPGAAPEGYDIPPGTPGPSSPAPWADPYQGQPWWTQPNWWDQG